MCTIDNGQYFLCNFDDQIFNAELVDNLPINIKSKYTFACSPVGRNNPFLSTRLASFARAHSLNEAVTVDYLKNNLKWSSLGVPQNIESVVYLENVYDVLDLYLWLSFRFPSTFPYTEQVKEMRIELEDLIEKGVEKLLDASKKRNLRSRNKLLNKTKTEQDSDKTSNVEGILKIDKLNANDFKVFNPFIKPGKTDNDKKEMKSKSKNVNYKNVNISNKATNTEKIKKIDSIEMKTNGQPSNSIKHSDDLVFKDLAETVDVSSKKLIIKDHFKKGEENE